jgi:diguanylate cyclase (GGDEF)-like protein
VPSHVRIRLLLITAVAVIAGAVWLAGERQRSAANRSFAEVDAAQALQDSMLDQEVGFYGYLNTGRDVFLQRYEGGRRRVETAFARAEQGAPEGEDDEREAIAEQRAAARDWQRRAEQQLRRAGSEGERALPAAEAAALERSDHRFRSLNGEFKREVIDERDVNQRRASLLTAGLIVLLAAAFGGLGYLLFERRARRELRRRDRHSGFTEVLQLARTESEAYGLVKRYLEETVPRSCATVLNRNNSANRLEASTTIEGTDLEQALDGAEPESCLAIRSGRTHERRADESALLECEICGASGKNATCIPSLVGGEVIGAVLIEHPEPLHNGEAGYLASSIAESAPIVANLRNLAIAEHRAATDALTGLPNSRSVHENIKRMAAHAGRTVTPLAAILFDLDHFKQVNDTYGHGKGDEVLAVVGAIAQDTLRASDFVGRYGGEEFLALLPDTGHEGAVQVAEKLREAISEQHVPGINRRITASFGVAVMPDEAREPDELVRMADRALYLAKATGRNRVETLPDEPDREVEPVDA